MEKVKMKQEFLVPLRIVDSVGLQNAAFLLKEQPRQAVVGETETAVLQKGGYVLLDFGKELQGGIWYCLQGTSEKLAHMRIVFGESVSEALSTIGEKNATNDHAVRDLVLPVSPMSAQRFGNTGFRFVKLEAVDSALQIRCVQAVSECADLAYKGSFSCSDACLNQIWETGAYTVHLNIQDYVWDGIKRDRLVWIGDMHPEISTISAVFGAIPQVGKSLDFIRDITPQDAWMNNYPSYSMWWLIIQRDWYLYTGDAAYLNRQKPRVLAMARQILKLMQPDGSMKTPNFFVDWSSNGKAEARVGFQAVLVLALDAILNLCAWYREESLQAEAAAAKEKALGFLPQGAENNKQVVALASLAGLVDANKAESVLTQNGAAGLSAFLGFYTLQALAKAGNMQAALDMIKNYWGKMIAFGATTFFEDFDVAWTENAVPIDALVPNGKQDLHGDFGKYCYKQFRHSLCHGWASGPTAFLSRFVLGVTPLEPGFKTVRIRPALGDLRYACGKYPTPYGAIEVSHCKTAAGTVETSVHAPKEITVLTA